MELGVHELARLMEFSRAAGVASMAPKPMAMQSSEARAMDYQIERLLTHLHWAEVYSDPSNSNDAAKRAEAMTVAFTIAGKMRKDRGL